MEKKNEVINLVDIPYIEYDNWEIIHNSFLETTFYAILEKYNLKQDCIDCGSLIIRVIFTFDSEGKIIKSEIKSESLDCEKLTIKDKESIKEQFLDHFQNMQFTPYFYNKSIEFQIGIPTKC